jgi:hypothetical protein
MAKHDERDGDGKFTPAAKNSVGRDVQAGRGNDYSGNPAGDDFDQVEEQDRRKKGSA